MGKNARQDLGIYNSPLTPCDRAMFGEIRNASTVTGLSQFGTRKG